MECRLFPLPFRVLAVLLGCCAGIAACGGPKGREGDIRQLIDAPASGGDGPLSATALAVERVATELPVQKDEYRIGANDVLNITVLGHEEFSSPRDFNRGIVGTVVKKDGNIWVPILGRVPAAGSTVEEFHEILTRHLAGYLNDPQVSVDILKYESQKFFVLGEVKEPGAFPVDGDTTLLEAIGMAKGVLPDGNLDGAYVVRGDTLLPINLADLLLRGDTRRNVFMRHGDLIFVPSAADQTVYVLGEVREPGAIQIRNSRLSLAHAIAEAGGVLVVEARRSSIKLIRGNWQEPTIYTLDYDTVLESGDRILLRPGDRVVVAPTTLTVMSRYMQQILPFLLGANYGVGTYNAVTK